MVHTTSDPATLVEIGRRTLRLERNAMAQLEQRIGADFAQACELILHCTGRVIVAGMGKSGHVARKIASTLASTGTPAAFLHPAEACHGDLGMVMSTDLVIALSQSGRAAELLTVAPLLKRQQIPLICMSGDGSSPLAQAATLWLDTSVEAEACPLDLAPTASSTVMLALGDALAIALLEARGFTRQDFALAHPGGALGRRLLLQVDQLMQSAEKMPRVSRNASLADAIVEMSAKGLGMTTIVDDDGMLLGVFTDGDLRRAFDTNLAPQQVPIRELMTPGGRTIALDTLAATAMAEMERHRTTSLVCVDGSGRPVGVVHLHALLNAGVE